MLLLELGIPAAVKCSFLLWGPHLRDELRAQSWLWKRAEITAHIGFLLDWRSPC